LNGFHRDSYETKVWAFGFASLALGCFVDTAYRASLQRRDWLIEPVALRIMAASIEGAIVVTKWCGYTKWVLERVIGPGDVGVLGAAE
ncbi:MAG: hypothetical protein ACO3RV_10075, partial [Luteolibacter sp.]